MQAIAAGCGIDPASVTSPTFVLCQPYYGTRTLYHLDAYRIRDLDEFLELGVDEYFEGPGITLIEWAERVAACLPDDYLEVQIEITGPQSRIRSAARPVRHRKKYSSAGSGTGLIGISR